MIKYIFNEKVIKENELLFWIYLLFIIIAILLTIYIGYKEIKKHENN